MAAKLLNMTGQLQELQGQLQELQEELQEERLRRAESERLARDCVARLGEMAHNYSAAYPREWAELESFEVRPQWLPSHALTALLEEDQVAGHHLPSEEDEESEEEPAAAAAGEEASEVQSVPPSAAASEAGTSTALNDDEGPAAGEAAEEALGEAKDEFNLLQGGSPESGRPPRYEEEEEIMESQEQELHEGAADEALARSRHDESLLPSPHSPALSPPEHYSRKRMLPGVQVVPSSSRRKLLPPAPSPAPASTTNSAFRPLRPEPNYASFMPHHQPPQPRPVPQTLQPHEGPTALVTRSLGSAPTHPPSTHTSFMAPMPVMTPAQPPHRSPTLVEKLLGERLPDQACDTHQTWSWEPSDTRGWGAAAQQRAATARQRAAAARQRGSGFYD